MVNFWQDTKNWGIEGWAAGLATGGQAAGGQAAGGPDTKTPIWCPGRPSRHAQRPIIWTVGASIVDKKCRAWAKGPALSVANPPQFHERCTGFRAFLMLHLSLCRGWRRQAVNWKQTPSARNMQDSLHITRSGDKCRVNKKFRPHNEAEITYAVSIRAKIAKENL